MLAEERILFHDRGNWLREEGSNCEDEEDYKKPAEPLEELLEVELNWGDKEPAEPPTKKKGTSISFV